MACLLDSVDPRRIFQSNLSSQIGWKLRQHRTGCGEPPLIAAGQHRRRTFRISRCRHEKNLVGSSALKSFRASSKAPIADFRGRRHPLRKAMRCGRHPHGDRLPESWECEKSRRRNFPMIGMTPLAYSGVAKADGGESKKDQLVRCSVSRCTLANGLISEPVSPEYARSAIGCKADSLRSL